LKGKNNCKRTNFAIYVVVTALELLTAL